MERIEMSLLVFKIQFLGIAKKAAPETSSPKTPN